MSQNVEEATIQGRRYVNPPLRALLDLHDELLANMAALQDCAMRARRIRH